METKHNFTPDPQLKLMEQDRQVLRYHHYAINTERTYRKWILRFIDLFGEVWLPKGFAGKIGPAARDLGWQYLFPDKKRSIDPRNGKARCHHVLASGLQKAVRTAGHRPGLTKRVTSYTFRHGYATHLLENGFNIRIVKELMGHSDVETTEIYTHVKRLTTRLSLPIKVFARLQL